MLYSHLHWLVIDVHTLEKDLMSVILSTVANPSLVRQLFHATKDAMTPTGNALGMLCRYTSYITVDHLQYDYRPSPASPTTSEDSDEADRSPSPPTTPTDSGSYYRTNTATTTTPPPLVAPMVYRPASQHSTATDNQNAMRWSYQSRWYTPSSFATSSTSAVERPCGSVMMPATANTSNTHAVAPQTSTDPYYYHFVQSDARDNISSSIQIK